jgi:hypothetical protein
MLNILPLSEFRFFLNSPSSSSLPPPNIEFTFDCEGNGKDIQFIFLIFTVVGTAMTVLQILNIVYQIYYEVKGSYVTFVGSESAVDLEPQGGKCVLQGFDLCLKSWYLTVEKYSIPILLKIAILNNVMWTN